MTKLQRYAVVLAVCIVGTIAFSASQPSVIGRALIVGSGTTAQRPTAAAVVLGGLYFNTDDLTCDTVGSLEVSNGVAWNPVCTSDGGATGGGPSFWYDAGAATILSVASIAPETGSQAILLPASFMVQFGTSVANTANLRGDGTDILSQGGIYDKSSRPNSAIYINQPMVTGVIGGTIIDSAWSGLAYTRVVGDIRAAGTGGTTDVEIELTDGVTTCTCAFPCNQATGPFEGACAPLGGGCDQFNANASISFTVTTIGDCSVGPDIRGNLMLELYQNPAVLP